MRGERWGGSVVRVGDGDVTWILGADWGVSKGFFGSEGCLRSTASYMAWQIHPNRARPRWRTAQTWTASSEKEGEPLRVPTKSSPNQHSDVYSTITGPPPPRSFPCPSPPSASGLKPYQYHTCTNEPVLLPASIHRDGNLSAKQPLLPPGRKIVPSSAAIRSRAFRDRIALSVPLHKAVRPHYTQKAMTQEKRMPPLRRTPSLKNSS